MLAGVGDRPDAIWVVGALALAIAFASASQDIAYDAYAVDVLGRMSRERPRRADRHSIARRWLVSGGAAITLAGGSAGPP